MAAESTGYKTELEPAKEAAPVLIVEHVDLPTAN
jgi:hypothetical protein